LRIARARRPRLAIGVEDALELAAPERPAMCEQRRPVRGPAEVAHRLAREPEGKIEAADPRARAREKRLERIEGFKPVYFFYAEKIAFPGPAGDGNRLRLARRAGEVDAVDPHSRYFSFQSTY